jgi:hypothetical protein
VGSVAIPAVGDRYARPPGTVLRGAPATGGEAEMLDFDHLTLFRTPYLIDSFQLVCSLLTASRRSPPPSTPTLRG